MQRIVLKDVLTGTPSVNQAQWRASSWLVRWAISARASVLVMTFSSSALGGLLALSAGTFDGIAWAACLLGLMLAHATNNQLNDLVDSARGIDEGNYFRIQYGAHVLEGGLLTADELWAYIVVTGSIALALGLWLVWHVGSGIVPLLLVGALFLLF